MNVLLLGDSHANLAFIHNALLWAETDGRIDAVVSLGDFGFWPNRVDGQMFLEGVDVAVRNANIPFYFIDGNHEDHDALDALVREHPGQQFVPYGEIKYITRGARWEWDGAVFGAFGGAYSIDRRFRTKGVSWFEQEMPDRSKIEQLGKVDILLTHDAPLVPTPYLESGGFVRDAVSEESQKIVYDALVATQPLFLVHGHWHVNYVNGVHGAVVLGLDCDSNTLYHSAAVFSTTDKKLHTIQQWSYRSER